MKNQIQLIGKLKMKWKINLPESKEDPEIAKARTRAVLNNHNNKDMASAFVFLYLSQPATTTEVLEGMSSQYKRPFDRSSIYRHLKKLEQMGLITSEKISSVIRGNDNEIHRKIKKKYYIFIDNIPKNFQERFRNLIYFYVTPAGEEYIPFVASDVLGFEVDGYKPKDKNVYHYN